jgi:hypothetical protein
LVILFSESELWVQLVRRVLSRTRNIHWWAWFCDINNTHEVIGAEYGLELIHTGHVILLV